MKNAKSTCCAAASSAEEAKAAASSRRRSRLLVAAALGGQAGELGEHQRARLEHVAQHAGVEPAGAEQQVGDHVEPAVLAPVAHAHRVAVADVDQAHLLEPLERLAQRAHRHAEVGGQRALGGELLAGLVAPAEERLEQRGEDLVGDEHIFGEYPGSPRPPPGPRGSGFPGLGESSPWSGGGVRVRARGGWGGGGVPRRAAPPLRGCSPFGGPDPDPNPLLPVTARRARLLALPPRPSPRAKRGPPPAPGDRLNQPDPQAWVPDLIVDDARKGRGVARLLLAAVEERARERSCFEIAVESSSYTRNEADLLYTGAGMTDAGRSFRKSL